MSMHHMPGIHAGIKGSRRGCSLWGGATSYHSAYEPAKISQRIDYTQQKTDLMESIRRDKALRNKLVGRKIFQTVLG